MISERNLMQKQVTEDQLRSIAPESKIPCDTVESRKRFMNVPGM